MKRALHSMAGELPPSVHGEPQISDRNTRLNDGAINRDQIESLKETRFLREATHRYQGHQYHNNILEGNSRGHFGDNYVNGDLHNHYTSPEPTQSWREDCIKSLHFPDMTQRELAIDNAHPQTFHWFWSSSQIGFLDWLTHGQGLYWVQGSPGSGKSTLMKYVARDSRLHVNMQQVSPGGSYAVAFYSFYVKSSETAGSVDGMLRSLLWQLMQALPQEGEKVVEQYRLMYLTRPDVIWAPGELLTALIDFLQSLKDSSVCILVDGLDEYHGNDEYIARYVDRLAASIPPQVRLCAASRPYPDFAFEFSNAQTFKLQEHTVGDISRYVYDRFKETTKFRDPSYEMLAGEAVAKAQGSFLWIKLACDELQRNWRRYQSLDKLWSCLDTLPAELSLLYLRIFNQLQADEKETLSKMLTILVDCETRLDIIQFCHIFDMSRLSTDLSSVELLPSRLERALQRLRHSRQIPAPCTCCIEEFTHSPSCASQNIDYKSSTSIDGSFESMNDTGRHIRSRTIIEGESICFFGSTYTCMRRAPHARFAAPFAAPSQIDSVRNCPHTAAYTCNSIHRSAGEWLGNVVEWINLIGRGLVQASASSISLAHETVTSFWTRESVHIFQKPPYFGKQIMMRACASYLDLLARFKFLSTEEIDYNERKRLCMHYPFLEFALRGLERYCRQAEKISGRSQTHILKEFDHRTWRYWRILQPSKFSSFVKLSSTEPQSMPLLALAFESSLDLTLKDSIP